MLRRVAPLLLSISSLALFAGCFDGRRLEITADPPADVDLVGLLIFESGREPIGSTGLYPRSPGASVEGPMIEDEFLRARRVELFGYARSELTAFGAPDLDGLSASTLGVAGPTEARLPPARYTAAGPVVDEAAELAPSSPSLAMTAAWLPRCPTACDLASDERRERIEADPDDTRGTKFSLALGDGSALVLTKGQPGEEAARFYRVRPEGAEFLRVSADEWQDAWLQGDGTIWTVDQLGNLGRGTVDAIERIDCPVTAERRARLSGVDTGTASMELYAVFEAPGVFRVYRGPCDYEDLYVVGSSIEDDYDTEVTAIGPGEAVAVFRQVNQVVHYRDGEIRVDTHIPAPTAVRHIPGRGTWLVTAAQPFQGGSPARLYRLEGDQWVEELASGRIRENPRGLWAFKAGLVHGGGDGFLNFYRRGTGECELEPVPLDVDHIIQLGDGLLVTGPMRRNRDQTAFYWIDQSAAPEIPPVVCPGSGIE